MLATFLTRLLLGFVDLLIFSLTAAKHVSVSPLTYNEFCRDKVLGQQAAPASGTAQIRDSFDSRQDPAMAGTP